MKKLLVLAFALTLATSSAFSVETRNIQPGAKPDPAKMQEVRKAREAAFEKKLGLTEEQILKSKELRKQGYERIKPVIDQIKDKTKEAEMVKLSRMSIQAQEEKLAVLDEEIRALEKQAMQIRKQNMSEFESILTSKQRRILKQMKKEGRRNYAATHSGPHHK